MYRLVIAATEGTAGKGSTPGGKPEGKPGSKVPPKKDNPQPPRVSEFWSFWFPVILIFIVMIFVMSRSQKKQMAKRQEMMDKIAKGTKVLLSSGIYGTVDAVNDNSMIVEIASGVKIKVAKAAIAGIDSPVENDKPESGKSEGK